MQAGARIQKEHISIYCLIFINIIVNICYRYILSPHFFKIPDQIKPPLLHSRANEIISDLLYRSMHVQLKACEFFN